MQPVAISSNGLFGARFLALGLHKKVRTLLFDMFDTSKRATDRLEKCFSKSGKNRQECGCNVLINNYLHVPSVSWDTLGHSRLGAHVSLA